jgi:hypothetical protein
MIKFDFERAISKWSPVIENTILKHKYTYCDDLIEVISIFCEWYSISSQMSGFDQNELPNKIKEIYEKLKSVDLRIEIIGEHLNMATGQVEYKLADGSFILKSLKNFKPSDDVYLKIFDHDFITFWRPDIIRDCKLNTILNG